MSLNAAEAPGPLTRSALASNMLMHMMTRSASCVYAAAAACFEALLLLLLGDVAALLLVVQASSIAKPSCAIGSSNARHSALFNVLCLVACAHESNKTSMELASQEGAPI
jgi:hypothetical protein